MRNLATALAALVLPAVAIAQGSPAREGQAGETPAPRSAKEANLEAAPQPPTTTREPGARPGDPERIVTTYPGNLRPPTAASLDKDYPVCRGTLQDNCRNPGEGGAPRR